jgi:hypothetical protein
MVVIGFRGRSRQWRMWMNGTFDDVIDYAK